MRNIRLRAFGVAFLGLALSACQPSAPDAVAVKYAWARLSPVAGRPAALYFTLTGAAKPDRLVAIDSALVQRIELHESMGGGTEGMMSMKPLAGVDVPPGGSALFQPGGKHAMLFGVDPAITPGTAIPLRFRFASGKAVEGEAKTVGAGGEAPGF
ncbi:copper chaperone PCu(A)C [Sphingomonas solaris]|uniref:Copper chaperone PCu(A)C n=1 Tax=Alterirhizorhabdus solaris TaxID=2529389 RepID=A0A558RCP0_9SPHN|nr:copper chaperone PCu(A)C [Sphingomonas solaris]TVV77245.1 copper chaperone PCu(A)C [Sphingomonas solaris]